MSETTKGESNYVLGDYDKWYKKCLHCGYDPGRSEDNRCWRCGRPVRRDFSARALKHRRKSHGGS